MSTPRKRRQQEARERRLAKRREERERQARMRAWHNEPTSSRHGGAHPPTEDEQANSPFYAEKVEQLLELVDGDLDALAELMLDVAHEHGLKTWATGSKAGSAKGGAKRSMSQLLKGYNTVDWVMDVIDAACEEFLS